MQGFGIDVEGSVLMYVEDSVQNMSLSEIFTIPTPPFNTEIRSEKKLLVNMRFSGRLKIASFRRFCKKSRHSSETTRRL